MNNPFDHDNTPLIESVRNMRMEITSLMNAVRRPPKYKDDASPFGQPTRTYSDIKLTSSGNTTTASASESAQVAMYTDPAEEGQTGGWQPIDFPDDITNDTTGATTEKKYDFFVHYEIEAWALEKLVWTDETTRATDLDTIDGVQLLSTDHTWRYVGTARYNGSSMVVSSGDNLGTTWHGTGNPLDPTGADPFTGTILDANGIRGYNAGALQFEDSSLTGRRTAGAGAVVLDILGVVISTYGVLLEWRKTTDGLTQLGMLQLKPNYGVEIITFGEATAATITDYNFNSGAFGSGWTSISGSPTFSAAHPISGSAYSMEINTAPESLKSDYITGLASGYQSLVYFYVYDDAARVLNFEIEYYNSGGASLGVSNTDGINLEGSQSSRRFAILFRDVAPLNTSKAKITISGGVGSGDLYVQSIAFYQGQGLAISNGNIIGDTTFLEDANVTGDLTVSGDVYGANLLGGIVAETNAEDILRVATPGGVSAFVGTINGAPSGASVAYNVTSGQEAAMVPVSTSHLGKLVLWNTTRGTSALILNCNTGTNTITLTGNAPAAWANGDTITIASQTVSGGGFSWVDIKITSGPTGKAVLGVNMTIASATAGDAFKMHPYSTFGTGKITNVIAQVNGINNEKGTVWISPVSDTIAIAWTGSPIVVILRENGYQA